MLKTALLSISYPATNRKTQTNEANIGWIERGFPLWKTNTNPHQLVACRPKPEGSAFGTNKHTFSESAPQWRTHACCAHTVPLSDWYCTVIHHTTPNMTWSEGRSKGTEPAGVMWLQEASSCCMSVEDLGEQHPLQFARGSCIYPRKPPAHKAERTWSYWMHTGLPGFMHTPTMY